MIEKPDIESYLRYIVRYLTVQYENCPSDMKHVHPIQYLEPWRHVNNTNTISISNI